MRFLLLEKHGFTFVEMFLVAALIATIGLALSNTLINGIKIWDRGYSAVSEEDISLFFEKISSELRNSISYSLIGFSGEGERISFATFVRTRADKNKDTIDQVYVDEIGKVEYYFDKVKGNLYRQQANYSQALENKFDAARLIVSDIKSLQFKYLHETSRESMFKEYAEGFIPSFISIVIEFGGDNPRRMTKLVTIPVGGD